MLGSNGSAQQVGTDGSAQQVGTDQGLSNLGLTKGGQQWARLWPRSGQGWARVGKSLTLYPSVPIKGYFTHQYPSVPL